MPVIDGPFTPGTAVHPLPLPSDTMTNPSEINPPAPERVVGGAVGQGAAVCVRACCRVAGGRVCDYTRDASTTLRYYQWQWQWTSTSSS